MKLFVEAGHGRNFRAYQQEDLGLMNEDGVTEPGVCQEYVRRLRGHACNRKHFAPLNISGNIASRLRQAIKRKVDLLLSFHLSGDPSGQKGGRVLYATDRSEKVAVALAQGLGMTVARVEPTGDHALLQYAPGVEIELGNIASQTDMRNLKSVAYCDALCGKLLDVIEAGV